MTSFAKYLGNFTLAPPPLKDVVLALDASLDARLPTDYRDFLLAHDGGDGFVGRHYLHIWKVGDLFEWNRNYEFPEYAPCFFAFGSNRGGEAFAFDRRDQTRPIVMVPFIGMSHKDGIRVADSFTHLLERMLTVESLF